MARYAYERLSAQDNSFLAAEGPTTPMHVSAIQIFDAGPLALAEGGIDIEGIRDAYRSVLHLVPRYRQKLAWIPFEQRAVWVDDPHFQLDYHIRHVALPHPGGEIELKRMAARVMSHHLDRNRPLWELWVIEGLEGGRFATVAKTHHCMVDGASGVELAQRLLSPTPQLALPKPRKFVPRPIPSSGELLRDQLMRRASLPLRALRSVRELRDEVDDLRHEVGVRARALADLAGFALSRCSETPLNGELGPHRRFDWHEMDLARVKQVRRALDCTVNDVVLAVVTEAVRQYLLAHQVDPSKLVFRTSAPVNVRSNDGPATGNRVSVWMVDLPVGEADPLEQVKHLHELTLELKQDRKALGMEMLMSAAEVAPTQMLALGMQFASGPTNTIVTNVPGPQFPLYMLGSKLEAIIPQVPLMEGIGLGIALMSYDGRVFWGFTADYELVPDIEDFTAEIDGAFERLCAAAGVTGDPEEDAEAAPGPLAPARTLREVEPAS